MSDAGEHHLFHRLQRAAHHLRTESDRRLVAAAGVTTAQCALLAILASSGPAQQSAVASALGLNESAMTPMVRRLCEAGLVARARNDRDRRVRALTLTPAGRRALDAAGAPFADINAALDAVFEGLDSAAIARALDALPATLAARSPSGD
jgi:DNA-binding MarR family transcriptional regulator